MKACPLAAAAAALVVVALLAPAANAHGGSPPPAPPTGAAGDGPGDVSHFNLARKDCVGTARNRGSKVWYTIADGVLSDVAPPARPLRDRRLDRRRGPHLGAARLPR
jgi:glucoamylase